MSNINLIPAMIVAFSVTTVFMFALRPVAKSIGLIDRPGGRKSHVGDVPIIGGVAMFAGMFAGLTLLQMPGTVLASVFVASLLLLVIGVMDDRFPLPAAVRMVTQVAVVLIMVYGSGLPLYDIGDPFGFGTISTGPFTLIFTGLVTLTMINAYNLIDGADGLAGTLALLALLAIAVVGGYGAPSTAIALTVSTAIVGFLVFNFPVTWNRPVRSFMGDAGSTLLGFTIVWVTLGVSQGADKLISPVICLWFAAIPIFDCLTCVVRRTLAGKSPFAPGRDHFHHTILRGGFGNRQTLGILTGLQLAYVSVALVGYFAAAPDFVMFAGWAILGFTQRFIIKWIAKHHRLFRSKRRRHRAAQS
jgi:UDP-GlcNAc:undecaprenyl-phosphate GlcNAc-1-phosphate transferase